MVLNKIKQLLRGHRVEEGPGGGGLPAPAPEEPREWTWMVYLAGDNNLEDYGRRDLLEMKQIGSSPALAVVAQFDAMRDGTRRYYLQPGTPLEADQVGALGQTNTGDPQELTRFLVWAMQTYPAARYGLVLWNHGSGWKEDDIYHSAHAAGLMAAGSEDGLAPLVNSLAQRTQRPALFSTTISAILARGIGYDDTSQDFLDNNEMKQAIKSALAVTGVPKLDLLGFDACLMNMLEVAYEVKDVASYVVGSQETEPGDGWPYGQVLQFLAAQPTMEAEELGGIIVQQYDASYGADENVTQSLLSLGQIRQVVAALNELCSYIMANQDLCELAVGRAARRAQKYADADYKDLYDLLRLLYERATTSAFKDRIQAVMDVLAPPGAARFVAAEAHHGYAMTNSHGVSIYFPGHEISPFYKRLDFASESLWDDMLRRLFGM